MILWKKRKIDQTAELLSNFIDENALNIKSIFEKSVKDLDKEEQKKALIESKAVMMFTVLVMLESSFDQDLYGEILGQIYIKNYLNNEKIFNQDKKFFTDLMRSRIDMYFKINKDEGGEIGSSMSELGLKCAYNVREELEYNLVLVESINQFFLLISNQCLEIIITIKKEYF